MLITLIPRNQFHEVHTNLLYPLLLKFHRENPIKKVTLILLKTYTPIPLIMKFFMLLDRFNDVNKINSMKSIAQVQCNVGTT